MATLSTITARVLNLLGSEASLLTPELESLVQTRYEHIYETWPWSKRLKDFTISLVAQINSADTTLVTVTVDSPIVTSIGTPFTSAMTGRQIQIGGERQYYFVNFVDPSNITIQDGEGNNVNWSQATASLQSWKMFQTIYTLPSTANSIVSLTGIYPIDELDGGRDRLDEMDPERLTTNSHPTYWCYAGANSAFTREIEVWPVPTQARLLRGQYNREAPILVSGTTVDIPTPLLVFAAAADACHMLHAKQGSMETMWENKALFFERKAEEVKKDYQIGELELTSPPTHLARSSMDRMSQFKGTDYQVTHQIGDD